MIAEPPVTPEARPSLRQARALATRERLLEAAASEFAEVGYHGSSLSGILERSHGVTKGALYFHFSSKETMALAVVEEMGECYRRLVERAAGECSADDPLRHVAALVAGVQELLTTSSIARAGERLALEGVAGPEWLVWPTVFWRDRFGALFDDARARGHVRPDVDAAGMARFVLDISHGAFATSLALTDLRDLAERVCANWEVVFGYMATEAWLEGWRSTGGMAAALRLPPGTTVVGGGG